MVILCCGCNATFLKSLKLLDVILSLGVNAIFDVFIRFGVVIKLFGMELLIVELLAEL